MSATVEVPAPPKPRRLGRLARAGVGVVAVAAVAVVGWRLAAPWAAAEWATVSTDDAYVNGHATTVAPRVAGQVKRVLVDDNMRVKAGDLLVELDDEPYRVQADVKKSAVGTAEADVKAAESQVRGTLALARGQRWKLQAAMEAVENQAATLRARVAALKSKEATLDRTRADLDRVNRLRGAAAVSAEEVDQRREAFKVAEAAVKQSREEVAEARVFLGLAPQVPPGKDPAEVPADLAQTFSGVRQALADLIQSTAQVGLPLAGTDATPKQYLDEFRRLDAEGNIDRLLEKLVPDAPAVKQAKAKLFQAQRDLAQAELNVRYCRVTAEIDGIVSRRNVNPGANVLAGQGMMAVRSLAEVWVDCHFKETQLDAVRVGQPVEVRVDAYPGRVYRGRVAGFAAGTGATMAVLPAENATGNFVKVVQRLTVRVDLADPNPEDAPLLAGLSVVPRVLVREPPTGPDAGTRLLARPTAPEVRP